MPNHCDSDMTITGDADELDDFLAHHVIAEDGTVLDLNTIRPYPAEFKELDRVAQLWRDGLETIRKENPSGEWQAIHAEYVREHGPWPKDGFNSGGYEWCNSNWGTKWGCYSNGHQTPFKRMSRGRVMLRFSTAWSPFDTELLQEVSARYPHLKFRYDSYEQGAGYQQHTVVQAGEVLLNDCREYRGNRGG